MVREKWYIRLLRFFHIIKSVELDEKEQNRIKFENCMKVRKSGACNGYCECCAWFFDSSLL